MSNKANKWDKQHLRNLGLTDRQITQIYESAVKEAAAIGMTITDFNPDKLFSFSDYPNTKARIDKLIKTLQKDVQKVIVNGVRSEWTLANNKNNVLCDLVFGDNKNKLTKAQERKYYSSNDKAREAFEARKTAGLNLSDRVWNYTDQFKSEIEMGLDLGLRNGLSADEMARDLKQYLKEPNKLFRRVRDEHGELQLSRNAKDYHPGQGVYRSSYKNAMRLARTETNMAYRTSDYTRWQQMDFVVGIEVKLSNNHTLNGVAFSDICDELKGKYPKDFKFTGWHPACRCHAVSILKTEEEMEADNERIMNGEEPSADSVNSVKDVLENFKKWVADNADRIEKANNRGTLPYFLKDNANFAGISVNNMNISVHRDKVIMDRKSEFARLKNDNNYVNVKFNERTGALYAEHKEHNFDTTIGKFGIPRGDYERITSDVLYDYGMSVVLLSEKQEYGVKTPDGLLNGIFFDIKGIEGNSHRIIKDVISKSSKQGAETVVLYFNDKNMFDIDFVRDGYGKYLTNSKNRRIKKVYCVVGKYLYRV